MRPSLLIALLLAVILSSPAFAQDTAPVSTTTQIEPVVGTYEATGIHHGTIVVKQAGDTELRLEATFEGGRHETGRCVLPVPGQEWRFDLEPRSVGIVQRLDADSSKEATRTLTLTRSKGALEGTFVEDGDRVPGTEHLVARRFVLLIHGSSEDRKIDHVHKSDEPFFKLWARKVAAFYEQQGYHADLVYGKNMASVAQALEDAGSAGRPYARVVFVGHGGFDGPIFYLEGDEFEQAAALENPEDDDVSTELWDELVHAVRHGTTPDARLWISACHSGGADRGERVTGFDNARYDTEIWVDDLAKATGRVAGGPAGETSAYRSLKLVEALEGLGPADQETRLATPSGGSYIERGTSPKKRRILNEELGR
jgi:hypothetical protein